MNSMGLKDAGRAFLMIAASVWIAACGGVEVELALLPPTQLVVQFPGLRTGPL